MEDEQGSNAGAEAAGAGAGAGAGSGQQGGQGSGQAGTFAVPKEYAEKGWAKKIKSQEDVFKLIDNLDSLAGKKMVVPDFEKAPQADIDAYLANLRGDTKTEDYVFPVGIDKEVAGKISKVLFDGGIPKALANRIITGYTAIEKEISATKFSQEGLDNILKTSFGDDYKKTAGETANLLKKHLSPEDSKLLESVPNEHLGIIYRLVNNFIKTHGIKEGAASDAAGGGSAGGNKEAIRKDLRAKIQELSKRPHTAAEKQALTDQLTATYK